MDPKIIFLGSPDMLPPELAENPDVVVLDPETLDPDVLAALDEAAGGALMAPSDAEVPPAEPAGGEGPLSDWAGEEEKEHAMGRGPDDEDEDGAAPMGRGPDDEDEENKDKDAMGRGRGPDEDEEEARKAAMGRGRRPSGRGSPLGNWARSILS